jgi:hypothetical protein
LSKFNGAKVKELKNQKGENVECLIIPIKDNNIYVSQKNEAFINLSAREKTDQRFSTHSLVINVDKETYKKMDSSQRSNMPIVGLMSPIGFKRNIKRKENEPKKKEKATKRVDFNINDMIF